MSRLISDTSVYLLWKVIPKGVGIDRLKVVRSVAETQDPAALHDFAEDVLMRRWQSVTRCEFERQRGDPGIEMAQDAETCNRIESQQPVDAALARAVIGVQHGSEQAQ